MKNWVKYILTAFLLFAVLPITAMAAQNGSGSLAAEENKVAVSVHIPDGENETITSLRLKLRVSADSGSMEKPDFQFEAGLKSTVLDADIRKEENGGYLVDLILSGKSDQVILDAKGNVNLGTLSVKPDSEAYQIKVEFAGEAGDVPKAQYVSAEGDSVTEVSLTDTKAVVLKKEKPVPPEPTEEPDTEVPVPPEPTEEPDTEAPAPVVLSRPQLTVTVKNASKSVLFTWTKVENADGYILLEYDSKTKAYKEIRAIANAAITAYSKNFTNATSHTFKIRAYKATANGGRIYSEDSAAVKATVAPAKVNGVSVKRKGTSKATISWKKVTKAKGYQIYRSTKKNGKYKLVKTIKKGGTKKCTLSYPSGKKYYYKIRAYLIGANNKRIYGAYSAIKTLKK